MRGAGAFTNLLTWTLVTPVVMIIVNIILRSVLRRMLADPANSRRVIIAGYNEISLSLATRLQADHLSAMKVEGFFDDRSAERLGAGSVPPLLGKLPDLPAYVKAHYIDVIFVAFPMRHIQRVLDLIDELRDTTASIYYVPDTQVVDLIQSRTQEILGIPVIAMCETPFAGYRGVVKRLTDIVLCMAALPLLPLLPLMAVIAVAVKLSSPGPAIFKQRRYDLEYLRHWSLLLDLQILARTALRLTRDANTTAV